MARFTWLLLVLAAFWSGAGAAAESLTLAANEWQPYTGDQLLNKGFATEVVSTALQRAGYDVTVVIEPWSRALRSAERGGRDGVVAAWYSDERAKKLLFSKPYFVNRLVFLKRTGETIAFKTLEDLRPYRIGVARDYAYDAAFDSARFLHKEQALDVEVNLKKLAAERIDLTVEDKQVALHVLRTKYPELLQRVEFVAKALSESPLYLAISRVNPHHQKIVEDFDRELALMHRDGSFAAILAKHRIEP